MVQHMHYLDIQVVLITDVTNQLMWHILSGQDVLLVQYLLRTHQRMPCLSNNDNFKS